MKKKPVWCEHIEYQVGFTIVRPGEPDSKHEDYWMMDDDGQLTHPTDNWSVCPICSTPRPKKKEK